MADRKATVSRNTLETQIWMALGNPDLKPASRFWIT
jgi:hypothetical protein